MMRPVVPNRILLCLAVVLSLTLATVPAGAGSSNPGRTPPERGGPAPVMGAETPSAIRDRYIVVFEKDAPPGAERGAQDEARERGARIHYRYGHALRGFAATLPQRALERLRRNPHVAYLEADTAVAMSDTQSPATWGLDRVDQRTLPLSNSYTYNARGTGITGYIIDTGIRYSHGEFGGRAVSGYDAFGGSGSDCNGHGTHVAGTVAGTTYGIAKSARLVAVRVLNCLGTGTTSGVIAGVDWVTGHHGAAQPAVANMSLGGGASSSLDNAVNNSINDGVTYVVAAGNDNANACNYSPARVPAAVTVGATTSSDSRSSFSNYGSCLDLFAPGSSITSAWHTSDSATNTISGTSMASPHVAGVAALYLEGNESASPSTVRNAIVGTATPGVLGSVGTNSPNLLLFSLLTEAPPPPPPPSDCSLAESYSGTLSGSGDYDYHPNGTYYYARTSGTHRGCLRGPSNADFDLYLYKWNGLYWALVARSESTTSTEDISYSGTAGYYLWEVYSYSGSGSYTFNMQRP